RRPFSYLLPCALLFAALGSVSCGGGSGYTPAGFTREVAVNGLTLPVAMAFAPDGRLFVTEKSGTVRVIKDGSLLPAPFVTIAVSTVNDHGLAGITLDPDFAANGYVYVYYTALTPTVHSRVSRFTASGDTAVPGSETVLFELDDVAPNFHQGGGIRFGADRKLYISTGDNSVPTNSQSLENLKGKLLRINADGSIPDNNPFDTAASGRGRAIWARGLRNPFTFAVQPGTGRIFINDPGDHRFEEVNEGRAGANYGWPLAEGPSTDPGFQTPTFSYAHRSDAEVSSSIAGGTFYNPVQVQYPAEYVGKYFFSDFITGEIRMADPAQGSGSNISIFASDVKNPVALEVSPDGYLYCIAHYRGEILRYNYNR
ncbi:MAG: PQQ-dependent sugar dehydrogenase, partial [Fibrella sp.]|nr:PQQ-dependent sugar dehydrogenase [Armatimonadota bacterium]